MQKPNIAVYGYYQYLKACPGGTFAARARERFMLLKPKTNAVYFESTPDLMRIYPKDTMIFSECQRGAEMFIIQDGTARVVKLIGGEEKTLGVLSEGDMLGEMSLLESIPRTASVIADTDCSFLVVNQQNFEQLVETQPQYV